MKMKSGLKIFCFLTYLLGTGLYPAVAELNPSEVYPVTQQKKEVYRKNGLFIGGDPYIDGVVVKNIRPGNRFTSAHFKSTRLVLDLECSHRGEPPAIPRPPYYQVSVSQIKQELIFSLWGDPQLQFHAPNIHKLFQRNPVISDLFFFPTQLEESIWTFVLKWKDPTWVEVFELSNPVRIVIDLKSP